MKHFKDTAGREWAIAINVDSIRQVQKALQVNLIELVDKAPQGQSLIERIINDPGLACDIAYVLVKDDADKLGVSDRDFGRAMGGDALDHATRAIIEEAILFFPPRRREVLMKAYAKIHEANAAVLDLIMKRLDQADLTAAAVAAVNDSLDSSRNSSGSAPGSSASTPVASV